jgi:hypothetical protein
MMRTLALLAVGLALAVALPACAFTPLPDLPVEVPPFTQGGEGDQFCTPYVLVFGNPVPPEMCRYYPDPGDLPLP